MTFLRQVEWARLAWIGLAWAAAIIFCYEFLDRPIARFAHAHLRDPFIVKIGGPTVFEGFTDIAAAMEPAALTVLAILGVASLIGKRTRPWAKLFIVAALATLVGDAAKNELKFFFGRPWPETWVGGGNASYIRDGLYGFYLFHGYGFNAFPSGHTTLIATPMAVLWFAKPHLRWLAALLVAIVIVGLIGLDYHFLSDCIAGLGLGTVVGGGAALLFDMVPWAKPEISPDNYPPL